MLPTDSSYGQWPRSGEIDIVEVRGNQDFTCGGTPFGRQLMGSTLHWVCLLIIFLNSYKHFIIDSFYKGT